MRISDWSSDVCSSDLAGVRGLLRGLHGNPRNLFRPRDRPGRGSDAARDTDGACANYHEHRFGAVDARRTTGADAVEPGRCARERPAARTPDDRSEENKAELQSLMRI